PWLEAKRAPRIADSMCTVFLFLRRRMERWSRVCQELGRVRKIPIGSNEATTSKNFSVIARSASNGFTSTQVPPRRSPGRAGPGFRPEDPPGGEASGRLSELEKY